MRLDGSSLFVQQCDDRIQEFCLQKSMTGIQYLYFAPGFDPPAESFATLVPDDTVMASVNQADQNVSLADDRTDRRESRFESPHHCPAFVQFISNPVVPDIPEHEFING